MLDDFEMPGRSLSPIPNEVQMDGGIENPGPDVQQRAVSHNSVSISASDHSTSLQPVVSQAPLNPPQSTRSGRRVASPKHLQDF